MSAKTLKYQPDPNKFDLVTHKWDSQGNLVAKNLYRKFIIDGSTYYERPVNSGNLWFENNQPAGRVEYTFGPTGKIASKRFDFTAEHREFSPPLTGAEKIHFELEQERARNAELKAEIEAIRKEREMLQEVREGVPAYKPEAKASPGPLNQAPKLTKRGD